MLETEAYITIKDYKEGFPFKLSFFLLKQSKSDIGKIGKKILYRINKSHIASTNANLWKNTSKRQSSFI